MGVLAGFGIRLVRWRLIQDLEHANGSRHVFELLLTQVPERQGHLTLDLLHHGPGNRDRPGRGLRLEASGHVHPITGNAITDDHEVAHVHADAKAHAGVFRQVAVGLGKLALAFHGALHGVHGAGTFSQEVVAHHVDHAAAVLANQPAHDGAVAIERGERGLFVTRHEGRVAHGIGGEDGGKSPFHDQ